MLHKTQVCVLGAKIIMNNCQKEVALLSASSKIIVKLSGESSGDHTQTYVIIHSQNGTTSPTNDENVVKKCRQ